MLWQSQLKGDSLSWLLENDSPTVRYLAQRDLLGSSPTDPALLAARKAAHQSGPIAEILSQMEPAGYWVTAGPGYNPKYRATVWALILLAQLGARVEEDPRIQQACDYLMEHTYTQGGQFTMTGAPSGTIDCLQGNLTWALLELGCVDPRLEAAFAWMARTVTGEGLASVTHKDTSPRYYAGKCGPTFACGANNKLPCAWGGVKVLLAFGKLSPDQRTPLIDRAIQHGIDFIFSVEPATAAYPTGWTTRPSTNWWKFGFPVFYVTDLLQLVEALVVLGCANDPRLASTLDIIRNKQDSNGRWALEYDYAGKTWVDFGVKKLANPWVTLRALRVLKAAGADG